MFMQVSYASGVTCRKLLSNPISWIFLLCFCWEFYRLSNYISIFNPFWENSVYMRSGSNFILSHAHIQFSQHYSWKRLSIPAVNDHDLLAKDSLTYVLAFIFGHSIFPLLYPPASNITIWFLLFYNKFGNYEVWERTLFVFFLQNCVAIQDFFRIHVNFRMDLLFL